MRRTHRVLTVTVLAILLAVGGSTASAYSPPGGLNENISSLLRVDLLVGAALKL